MDKDRSIPKNSTLGNRNKSQETAWHLEELQAVGHVHCPDQISENHETESKRGQQTL